MYVTLEVYMTTSLQWDCTYIQYVCMDKRPFPLCMPTPTCIHSFVQSYCRVIGTCLYVNESWQPILVNVHYFWPLQRVWSFIFHTKSQASSNTNYILDELSHNNDISRTEIITDASCIMLVRFISPDKWMIYHQKIYFIVYISMRRRIGHVLCYRRKMKLLQ